MYDSEDCEAKCNGDEECTFACFELMMIDDEEGEESRFWFR